MSRPHPIRRTGFTLIEIIIVVTILGILAAITLPQFAHSKDRAEGAALTSNVSSINSKVASEYARAGTRPTTIESGWFMGGDPSHPQNEFGIPSIETQSLAGAEHPANKVLTAGVPGAYWYNPETGVFRARVEDQGSAAATLTYYNKINNAEESALGNYPGGGGGGGS